jgi:hypothetical protein
LFKGIDSENLMRDLAFVIHSHIFIPGDLIIVRNQLVEEISYIIEGSGSKLNKKNKIFEEVKANDFCGEFALFSNVLPKFSIRAETFMLVKLFKKT